jgi:hypothetical protein
MHLLSGIAIQPNLELKTWPKQLLGYLPLVIALPGFANVRYPHLGLWGKLVGTNTNLFYQTQAHTHTHKHILTLSLRLTIKLTHNTVSHTHSHINAFTHTRTPTH